MRLRFGCGSPGGGGAVLSAVSFAVVSLAVVLLVVGGMSDSNEPRILSNDQLAPLVYAAIVCGGREGPA